MPFTENAPIETGFAATYADKIEPQLHEMEFERQAVTKRAQHRTYGIVGLAALAVVLAFVLSDNEFGFGILLVAGTAAAFAITYLRDNASDVWVEKIHDIVLPPLCAHAGDLDYKGDTSPMSLEPFRGLRLLPNHEREARSHRITGTHAGLRFELSQLVLTQEQEGRNKGPVFRGLMVAVALPASLPDPGRISLRRDRGGVGNTLSKMVSAVSAPGMSQLTFPSDSRFEAAFETYAEDPDAARAWLSDENRATLLRLGRGQAVTAGIQSRQLYLMVPRPAYFLTPGWHGKSTSEIEQALHGSFSDLAEVLGMMEILGAGLHPPDSED